MYQTKTARRVLALLGAMGVDQTLLRGLVIVAERVARMHESRVLGWRHLVEAADVASRADMLLCGGPEA